MTMKPRTIGIAVIAASSLLLVILRGMVRDEQVGAGPPPRSVASPTPARYPVKIRHGAGDQLRDELAALRAEVAQLHAGKPRPEQRTREEQLAIDQRRAAAKTAVLENAFANDHRDASWSPQAESKLRDAFGAADVAGGRLEELGCGATLCRYSVRFDSVAQREDGSGAITGLARWGSRGFGGPDPADPLRFVFYVSRDRESFPNVAVD
jgi:hypothetical protein